MNSEMDQLLSHQEVMIQLILARSLKASLPNLIEVWVPARPQ